MLKHALQQFESIIPWAQELTTASGLLNEPIGEGKWSPVEIIAHLHYWDVECLQMVSQMKEGAVLSFTAIQPLNEEAAAHGRTKQAEEMIREFVQSRRELIDAVRSHTKPEVVFTLDGETSDLTEFVKIFVHHDEHHRKQIDAFLESSQFGVRI